MCLSQLLISLSSFILIELLFEITYFLLQIHYQINFRFACSLSSIEIKITPSGVSKSRASNKRGYMNVSQAEWEARPLVVRSKIFCSSFFTNTCSLSINSCGVKIEIVAVHKAVRTCIIRRVNINTFHRASVGF